MALSYDTTSTLASGTGTRNWSHGGAASLVGVAVVKIVGGGVDETSGVTYGGVPMIRRSTGANTSGETGSASIWTLPSPGNGTKTVEITRSGSTAYIATCETYLAASGYEGGFVTEYHNSSTSISDVATSLTIGSYTVFVTGALYSGENALSSITDKTGQTRQHSQDFGNFTGVISRRTASYVGPGTLTTFGWTQSSDDAGWAVIAIREVAPEQTITLGFLDAGAAIYTPTVVPDQLIGLPLIEAVGGGSGTIAYEASLGSYTSTTVQAAHSITSINQSVALGDTILVALSHYSLPTTTTITDNLGNTYTEVSTGSYPSPVFYIRIFAAEVTNAGTLTTITASFTPDKGYVTLSADHFSGIDNSTGSDTGDFNGSDATPAWSSSATIAAGGIIVGGVVTNTTRDFTAGADSGSPSTAISLGTQRGTGTPNADPSNGILYAIAGGSEVTGFSGTAGIGSASSWVGTGITFSVAAGGDGHLFAPTIEAVAGPSTQEITLPLLDASAAIYALTLLPQPVTITLAFLDAGAAIYAPSVIPDQPIGPLDLLDAGAAIYAPSVLPAPYPITLPLLDAGAAIFEPALAPDQFLTLDLIDAGAAIYAPTVAPPPYEITLDLLDAGAAIYAPTVAPAPYPIVLGFLDAGAAIFDLTVLLAPYPVALPFLDAGPAIYTLSVAPAPYPIVLDLLDAGSAIYAPTVAAVGGATQAIGPLALLSNGIFDPDLFDPDLFDTGPAIYALSITAATATITLDLIDAGAAIYAPSVIGDQFLVLDLLDAGAAIYAPTVAAAPYPVTLPLLDGAAAIYALSVLPGAYQITLPLLDGAAAIYAVEVAGGNVLVIPLLDAGAAIYEPQLAPAPYPIVLDLIDAGSAIYAPTLTSGTQYLVLPLVDSGADIFDLSVLPGAYQLELGFLDSGAAIFDLIVFGGAQAITLPLLDSGVALYPPTVTWYSTVTLPLLDGAADLWAPLVANTTATLTGRTLNRLNGQPIPNCTVLVYRSSDNVLHASTTSNSLGVYTVPVAPGVEYWAVAWSGIKVQGVTDRDLVGS